VSPACRCPLAPPVMAAFVITRDESASLHPDSVAPRIANLPEWRAAHLLARLHRQAAATGDHAA
jgi:hypothetical protein